VTEVSGSRLSCRLFAAADGLDERGAYKAGQIGALIKIATPSTWAFGFIDNVSIEGASADTDSIAARAEIDLLGEAQVGRDSFSRGITIYPVLGAPVFGASERDMSLIYETPDDATFAIGSLHQYPGKTAYLKSQEFFSKHSAILGTTGAGKSCALSIILRTLLTQHPHGHVVVLDPHGEYGAAFDDLAERITPDDLRLPYWMFGFDEITEVLCSKEPTARSRETPILKEAIVAAKRDFLGISNNSVDLSVDAPTPYRISDVRRHVSDAMGKLLKADTSQPYVRLMTTIDGLSRDRRYRFMFGGLTVRDEMAEILGRILRIPVDGRPLTVLDISAVPSEIVNVIVSLVCRLIFDFAVWSDRDEAIPVLLACEEAHRYIPRDQSLGFEPTQRSIARFAKEGRKYGLSLCLVTQRPSELSETILSQCNTVVALRMTNREDQNFVRSLLPDDAAGLLNALPTLGQQEAILVGEGVSHPIRIRFADLEPAHRPQGAGTTFPQAWDADSKDRQYLDKVLGKWRGM
jgi:DNA helicase HerA-like ATPase